MLIFMHLGLNEADTFKFSSIQICWDTEQRIYTQMDKHDAMENGMDI